MSIRKQWLIALITTALLSAVVHTVLLNYFINKTFLTHTSENYKIHLGQIKSLSEIVLTDEGYTAKQIEAQLQAHLSDPIIEIKLFNSEGIMIAQVKTNVTDRKGMMKSPFMDFMMGVPLEQIEALDIYSDEQFVGYLVVSQRSSIANSMETRMFTFRIISNSVFAFGIIAVIVVVAGIAISRQMSLDLIETLNQAVSIDIGIESSVHYSKVTEIKALQQNLEFLQNKLKLKQKSRQNVIDELMHQARTPLTILRTHLEALKDGIIEMDMEKISLCESQIDNITAILSNLDNLIDANPEAGIVRKDNFELYQTLEQIVNGLKLTFQKKGVQLTFSGKDSVILYSDKYKLSQSVYNIMTNALKYTPTGGKVSLSYEESEDFINIIIADTGSGISKEDQKNLFNAYFRGKNSANISGEGLGLFIAKDNLDKINATISVDSAVGIGSKFIISLPKKKE